MIQILLYCVAIFLTGCGDLLTPTPKLSGVHKPYVVKNSHGKFVVRPQTYIELDEKGMASYYGAECHGKKTALGSKFNMHAYTAAHRTAHLPSVAIVSHGDHKRIVLLNDRGPFAKNRILDCSHKLAQDLGFAKQGHAKVHIKVLKNETLALKQNGGNLNWDGSTPFPLITRNTRELAHFKPKIVIHHPKNAKKDTPKRLIRISIKKLNRSKKKIKYV